MKHLFAEPHESWTDEARELDRKAVNFLTPLVKELCDAGYSLRDVEVVLHSSVNMVMSATIVTRNMLRARAEREARLEAKHNPANGQL